MVTLRSTGDLTVNAALAREHPYAWVVLTRANGALGIRPENVVGVSDSSGDGE